MEQPKPTPTVVIFITREGVREVQIHSPGRRAEAEGRALYERVSPIVDRLHRAARSAAGSP